MNRKQGWFLALLVMVALLVVACGPTMTTPTPASEAGSGGPTTAPTSSQATAGQATAGQATAEESPTAVQAEAPTAAAVSPSELPVSQEDWHVLGPADAAVTVIEYSDFQ
jgi:hypothetical protein